MIRLTQPWSLAVLLLFFFVLVRLRTFPRASALRRAVAWLCLGVALAGPEIVLDGAPESVTLALDLSSSTARSLAAAVARWETLVHGLPASVPIGAVAFGDTSHVVARPSTLDGGFDGLRDLRRLVVDPERTLQATEREATDIAAGLESAGRMLSPGERGRIVLASDGWETVGDARRAASSLAARGIVIDVLPVGELPPDFRDAAVEDVEAPAQVLMNVPFEVRAVVRSTVAARARVTLLDAERPVAQQDVPVPRGAAPLRFTVTAEGSGEHRYVVRVRLDGDQEPRNDVAGAVVNVLGRPRILWVGSERAERHGTGIDLVQVQPEALRALLPQLRSWDAVVLAEVSADSLPPDAGERIRQHVGSEGGGLLMVGGPRSFGPGGYRSTAIEEVLPVDLDPASRRARTPLALALVIDKSGSMAEPLGRGTKIDGAREAATVTASLLDPGDRFALVAFDAVPARLMSSRGPPRADELRTLLASLRPSGGTRILPAIDEAAAVIGTASGARRHIVLLTDGRGEGGDFERRARELAATGFTLSVIAVGEDADGELLRALASAGGGRFEVVRDVTKLAAILRREVVMARGPVLRRERANVVVSPHPVLAALGGMRIPPIFGYVSTAPKRSAVVPLRTDSGDPILALGRYGLGRTAALTTDVEGSWSGTWRDWPGTPRLMTQVLRWIVRAPAAGQVAIRETRAEDGWTLVASVEDAEGNRLNGKKLSARLSGPDGREDVIPLEQRGLGAYVGMLGSPARAPTRVVLEDHGDSRAVGQGWIGLGYSEEYRVRGPNRDLLDEVRRATGGRWLDDPSAMLALRPSRPRVLALWPALALLALALLLGELFLTAGRLRHAATVPRSP
jgi:Ca-activated chloride channel family protein